MTVAALLCALAHYFKVVWWSASPGYAAIELHWRNEGKDLHGYYLQALYNPSEAYVASYYGRPHPDAIGWRWRTTTGEPGLIWQFGVDY